MSNREMVIDLVSRLPEDMPLADIVREIDFLAGLQSARAEARRGEGLDASEARSLVESWVSG
ncbi:hypothetical protein OpiT1DRAFT_02912 [Opitutaceae bacterium TAV1]|nr:hypothetical protein OPIT5_11760 [Opitutaceae bacterium TAV5]EIP98455.1 hypothetical protein OpiT1DRAFT_02912 [Opitutaceae bacterium TAV1]